MTPFVPPGCPACGATVKKRIARAAEFFLVRCPSCRLVYADPQRRARVRAKYLKEYDLAQHFGPLANRKRVLYQRRLGWLPAAAPGCARLCDVGCGDGQFLDIAKGAGWEVCGIEMNGPAAQCVRGRGIPVYEGPFEEIEGLPWGTFDVVTSWDSLEHTPEPRLFAARLARLLKPGGTLALTTLNQRSLAWYALGTNWSMVVEDHFTYWNRRSLTGLLAAIGLTIDRVEIFGLGRDFVDRLGRLVSALKGRAGRRAGPAGGWDVRPSVLRAEECLNRFFNVFGGGVGLAVRARRSE